MCKRRYVARAIASGESDAFIEQVLASEFSWPLQIR